MNETEILIMGAHAPSNNEVFILNTEIEQETEQLKYIGKGGDFNFGTRSNVGNVKVKENKVLSVVYSNNSGHPNLIGFNKGDT